MKKGDNIIYGIIYTVIIGVCLYTLAFTLVFNLKGDGYILGDWLINYQDGGFKRRGLSGSMFFLLQDIFGLKLRTLVYIFQFFIITFFFFSFYQLIRVKNVSVLFLTLVLSALTFICLLDNVDYVGKKEFILFALFIAFISFLDKGKMTIRWENIFCVLIFITVLMHEIVVFFVSYFVIAHYIKHHKKAIHYIKYYAAAFIPAIAILIFGHNINEGHSIEILRSRGVEISSGILFWDIDEKSVLVERLNNLFPYIIGLIICIVHIYFYCRYSKIKIKHFYWMLLFCFLYSLPLFYLALDWGRWYYVHMMMTMVLLILLLGKRNEEAPLKTRGFVSVCAVLIILFSLIYRVDIAGRFSFEGLFYRVFVVPQELINKVI